MNKSLQKAAQPHTRDSDAQAQSAWFKPDIDSVFEQLGTDADGLSTSEAQQRLERHGPNRFGGQSQVNAWQVLLHQFKSPLIYVLLGALLVIAVIAFITGEWRWADAIVIGIILVINATVGFFQEYRAEHAVEELMKMVAPKATVRRNGERKEIDAGELVPGDVVEIGEGDVVPADVRLFDVSSLQVNEAALTGESVPADKSDAAMPDAGEDLPAPDQTNMGFMGTAVTSGHACAVVVATGQATRIGEIATQVEQAGDTQTPLQRRIEQLARWTTAAILVIAVIAFAVGLWMGRSWVEMIILAIALAVAAIPEGLPIVVTVALSIGVHRMAQRHAVIRRLPAVDTLGSCTTILSDKTGTLTQNRMTVRSIHAGGHRFDLKGEANSSDKRLERDGEAVDVEATPALYETLRAGVLCNNATLPQSPDEPASGDPMEVALLQAGNSAGLGRDALEETCPRTDEVPFQTERRFMATIHEQAKDERTGESGPLVLIKGAPEAVLDMCANQLDDGGNRDLDRDAVLRENDALAGEGLRVLAMAIGRGDQAVSAVKDTQPQRIFSFAGLQGMLDPPRPSAVEAVDNCHRAGIRVIMVTGDHARTAAAIARDVHIGTPLSDQNQDGANEAEAGDRQSEEALPEAHSGREIGKLSDEQIDAILARTDVFARIEPAQKTQLVERLKATGQIVAVTGDGVNDAPALKAAHIGAAMGSGTDVAKEASDMVITDDNFASVYSAVEEGRTAFRNIRMATFFLFSTGAAMVLLILAALGLRWPLPLLPAQILWCNVVTNGIADVALSFEPGERALYRQPPRPPSEGILNRILIERLVIVGLWLAVGTLGIFLWKWGFDFASWTQGSEENLTVARTAALTAMVLFQMVHVFNCRSEYVSVFKKSLLTNKVLLLGVLASLLVHIAAIYLPWTQTLLSLTALDAMTWLVAAAIAATAILVNELHKRLRPASPKAE